MDENNSGQALEECNPRLALEDTGRAGENNADTSPIFSIQPIDGCQCRIIIKCDNNTTFKYPNNQEFVYEVEENDDAVDDVIENALLTMKRGERKHIQIPCRDGEIQNTEDEDTVTAELTLVDLVNRKHICYLSLQEKYDTAMHHKNKGVEVFQKGQIERAFRRFSIALKYLILMHPRREIPQELQEQHTQLRVQCHSNMAACQLQRKSYEFAVDNCTKALNLDAANVKCLYRRAEAFVCLNKLDLSKKDVLEGLKIEPNSKSFCTMMNMILNKQKDKQ